jgi:hypothetical protein
MWIRWIRIRNTEFFHITLVLFFSSYLATTVTYIFFTFCEPTPLCEKELKKYSCRSMHAPYSLAFFSCTPPAYM